ncbi:hypothetical protein L2E81_18250 [Planktothrix agardhii 1033]|nr:hypothetical protein [Planktothrix agardhii 1033]
MGLTALVYSNINQVSNTFKEAERVQEVILKVNVMERLLPLQNKNEQQINKRVLFMKLQQLWMN